MFMDQLMTYLILFPFHTLYTRTLLFWPFPGTKLHLTLPCKKSTKRIHKIRKISGAGDNAMYCEEIFATHNSGKYFASMHTKWHEGLKSRLYNANQGPSDVIFSGIINGSTHLRSNDITISWLSCVIEN